MKKLLSVALCAAASVAMATEEITIANVGVMNVAIPANQQNTIIAASFNDLSKIDEAGKVGEIVKTTNLSEGDELRLYKDGKYSVWTLKVTTEGQTTVKTWEAVTTVTTGGGTETGASASDTLAPVGDGLWFIRKDASEAMNLVIYGAYVTGGTKTVAAKTWTLCGNAKTSALTISEGAAGDRVTVVKNGVLRDYNYKAGSGKGWYYVTTTEANGIVKNTKTYENPTVAAGEGFWYYTQSEKTINFD